MKILEMAEASGVDGRFFWRLYRLRQFFLERTDCSVRTRCKILSS